MDTSLLATKIGVPPSRGHEIPRARLFDALNQSTLTCKLTLISAPAGYGKTTLLRQWARAVPASVAWFSIDEVDNDRVRFHRYLAAAWETVWPEVAESPLGVILGASGPDLDAVLPAWISLGSASGEPIIFVLDDYHLIEDPAIHRDITFLLDHLPPPVHFVIAGRDEPPLPLARYRVRQDLAELRTDDLRFRVDEAAIFLRERAGHDLSRQDVASITGRLEGWIAGLLLISLGGPGNGVAAGALGVTGGHRFIADYLREEVLARLPADDRRFLLQTSVLDQLCGPLCDAVMESTGSLTTLEAMERANLFVVPLDDHREWFRLHGLFAEVLRGELARIAPQEVPALHCRAAHWYLDRGMPDAALYHAIAGNDIDTAREIFDRYATEQINSGAVRVVERWLDSLPDAWLERYAVFGLVRAGCLMAAGAFEQGLRRIDEVEARLTGSDDDQTEQLARVHAVRCFVACAQNDLAAAVSRAGLALRDLPGGDLSYRVGVYLALGDTYRRNGLWDEARHAYLNVLTINQGRMSPIRATRAYGALADLEVRRGRLRDAAHLWQEALNAMRERETWGRLPLDVSGWVYLRFAELLYEWDDLAGAREHLERGLARAESSGDALSVIAGHLIAARLHLTEGDLAGAGSHLEWARPLVTHSSFPDWTSRFDRCQVDIWLRGDRSRSAIVWANSMLRSEAFARRPENESARLALVRVLIAQGNGLDDPRVRTCLDALMNVAAAEGRMGVQIEALALQALAHGRRGETAAALTALEHAFGLAEPEGYLRLFADLGLPMARLLQEARARRVYPDYATRILGAFREGALDHEMHGGTVPEPLSDRERDVLRLLAAGLTNREIGDDLFISPETVKKHVGAIIGKLGVANRTEAAARARDLDLLGR